MYQFSVEARNSYIYISTRRSVEWKFPKKHYSRKVILAVLNVRQIGKCMATLEFRDWDFMLLFVFAWLHAYLKTRGCRIQSITLK